MGPKLLFVMGIVAVHGVLAAGWVGSVDPASHPTTSACVNAPAGGALPDFTPRRELLAINLIPDVDESEAFGP